MSASQSLFAFAATVVTGFALVTTLLLTSDPADAAEAKATTTKPHAAAKTAKAPAAPQSAPQRAPAPAPAPQQQDQKSGAACTCPNNDSARPSLWPRPKYADLKPAFDEGDEIAALENLQLALSETSDGGTYVWHRHHGWLSGVVHPTSSFKDDRGKICRHIQIMLTSGTRSSKTEGIACRLPSGQWQLEG